MGGLVREKLLLRKELIEWMRQLDSMDPFRKDEKIQELLRLIMGNIQTLAMHT
jgi:hypothetical protein